MSRYLIRRIEETPSIVLRTQAEITTLEGGDHLERVQCRDNRTQNVETHDIRPVFVMTAPSPIRGGFIGAYILVNLSLREHQRLDCSVLHDASFEDLAKSWTHVPLASRIRRNASRKLLKASRSSGISECTGHLYSTSLLYKERYRAFAGIV